MANTGPTLIEYEKYVHIAKRVNFSVDHGTMVPFEWDKFLFSWKRPFIFTFACKAEIVKRPCLNSFVI